MSYKFTIIITQEDKWYVARALELDVVSQGESLEQAQANLKEAVELYLEDEPEDMQLLSQTPPLITTLEIKHA